CVQGRIDRMKSSRRNNESKVVAEPHPPSAMRGHQTPNCCDSFLVTRIHQSAPGENPLRYRTADSRFERPYCLRQLHSRLLWEKSQDLWQRNVKEPLLAINITETITIV